MRDLADVLVEAATTALHDLRCGCGGSIEDADEHRENARVAAAAVVVALADRSPNGWWLTTPEDGRELAARLTSEEDRNGQ